MKKTVFAISIAAAGLASAEQPFSYKYIEGAHYEQDLTLDVGLPSDEIEGDAGGVAVSYDFDGVLLQAGYISGDVDKAWGYKTKDLGADVDFSELSLFVGGVGSPNAKTSVFGGIGYQREEWDTNFGDADTDVWTFGAGARYWLLPMVELNGGANFVHARFEEDSENDVETSIGLRFQPIKWFSVGATFTRQIDAESDIMKADIRFQL